MSWLWLTVELELDFLHCTEPSEVIEKFTMAIGMVEAHMGIDGFEIWLLDL